MPWVRVLGGLDPSVGCVGQVESAFNAGHTGFQRVDLIAAAKVALNQRGNMLTHDLKLRFDPIEPILDRLKQLEQQLFGNAPSAIVFSYQR
ncbi:MAG: hypothetical protein JKP98_21910 [Rhodobacteraceae bacterium]|nr:hypothetical protein [Paracoccaceae bacterium]